MKDVLKLIIYIALYIMILLYLGRTTISFHPFSFSMEEGDRVWMFILFSVFDVIHTSISYAQGFNDGIDSKTCDGEKPEEK